MGRLFIFTVFIHLNTSDKGLRILCWLLTKMTSVNSHSSEIFLSAHPGCIETPPFAAILVPKPKAVLAIQVSLPPLGIQSPYLLPGPTSRYLWVGLTQTADQGQIGRRGREQKWLFHPNHRWSPWCNMLHPPAQFTQSLHLSATSQVSF